MINDKCNKYFERFRSQVPVGGRKWRTVYEWNFEMGRLH